MNGVIDVDGADDSVVTYLIVLAIVACVVLLGIFFPDAVTDATRWFRDRASQSRRRGLDHLQSARRSVLRASVATWSNICRTASKVLARRWIVGLLTALALAPPLIALTLGRGVIELDGFDRQQASSSDAMPVVAALLKGEHLIPPAPLPPELFTTREVTTVRPALATASRAWDLLDDAFSQRLLQVYRMMKEQYGYDMVLLEGYRSPERQNELAAAGNHVTNAAAWQSYHQYGLAADSAFLKDGRVVISERDPWAMRGYEIFGQLAAAAGLTWGGSWKMADLGHVELRTVGGRKRLGNP